MAEVTERTNSMDLPGRGVDDETYSFSRRAFDGGSTFEVGTGIFLLIVFVFFNYVNIYIEDFYYLIPIVTIPFGVLIAGWIIAEINDMKPATISIGPDGVVRQSKGRLQKQIPWGPDVVTDVILSERYMSEEHGPLAGYRFYIKGKVAISISAENGFPILGIKGFWDRYITIIEEHQVQKGDDLIEYLKSMKRV